MTTETQGVVSSAAVAVPLHRARGILASSGRWFAGAYRVVAASMRRMPRTPVAGTARVGYLERSLMAREADRL